MPNISQLLLKYKITQLHLFVAFLLVYALCALFYNLSWEVVSFFGVVMGTALGGFYLLKFLTKKPKNILNSVISGLILFLTLHYGPDVQALWIGAAAMGMILVYKFFLQYKGISWVNPVVFGLLFAHFIGGFVSWWGAAFAGYWSLGLVLIWCLFGLRKWMKHKIALLFLVGSFAVIWMLRGWEVTQFVFTDATIYFLAGVMLVEPKSSPVLQKQQIPYALVALLVYHGCVWFHVANAELVAILAANIFFFIQRVYPSMLRKYGQKGTGSAV